MRTKLYFDNIKCHGCGNTIAAKLKSIGFDDAKVLVEEGAIEIDERQENLVDELKIALKKLGYPEKDQSNLVDSAKSYVSCMIGRVKGPVSN